jgi:hypothetical protein
MNNDALAHNVRGWVHYDNMAAALQKQIVNTRKQRDAFEEQIQVLLKQHQMPSAVIQISGGQLQLQEEKATSGLTMKALLESAQSFFRSHPEIPNPDKMAAELLDHIKQQRTVTTSLRLKKLKAQPAQV